MKKSELIKHIRFTENANSKLVVENRKLKKKLNRYDEELNKILIKILEIKSQEE